MTATRSWIDEAQAILRESPKMRVLRDVPLSGRTFIGIGGPARLLLLPEEPETLAAVLGRFTAAGVPFDVLGAGSNLLVADSGPSFVVVSTESFAAEPVLEKDRVRAGAGTSVPKLVKRLQKAGLSGLEFAEGIPGSVGGCVRMNAGWHEGMFGQAVVSITTLTRQGVLEEITTGPGTFAYRASPGLGTRLVVAATLRLKPDDPARIQERVLAFRRHRVQTQPTAQKNAGCMFKNPQGDHAGRLIDSAGLKGLAAGRAMVSDRHANFIINRGGATFKDVATLIDRVREAVREATGVTLEQEVILWT